MSNIPEVKIGIAAVSRDCFPIALSKRRLDAVAGELKKLTPKVDFVAATRTAGCSTPRTISDCGA
jgi:hypothetical protein